MASEVSTVLFTWRARILEILTSRKMVSVGTITARLAVRLGDVWVTLVRRVTWNISEKLTDIPYFPAGIVI